jgi:ABC-type polysaccharide/polyol phosphate transport system ATPase subunit
VQSEALIEVAGLTKEFRVESAGPSSLFNRIRRALWLRGQTRCLKAVSDVTFCLQRGRSLGLVGNNGAGKSTLLRLLSGIYRPTSGTCRINGRVIPVLELGAGMHHELSVRENVFLYGAMIGFRRAHLVALFDTIIAFAELEDFVEAKVKELSTGMRQRLTFSIGAQLDTDLILVDELLAVGDRHFREKCFAVFKRRQSDGKSVVLAAHDLDMIAEFCDVCLLMDHGRLRAFGPTRDVLALYTASA